MGKRLRESSEPIQIDPPPEQKSKRFSTEVVQQAHEVKQNTIPPGQFQVCHKKQQQVKNSLTLANDPQTASFAHMVSKANA